MIDEKYKGKISIICMCLSVLLILSTAFLIPNSSISSSAASSKESVLNKDQITEINIEIEEEDWNWLIDNATQEEYRSANVTINGETFYNVGLRPKGNSSLKTVANSDSDRYSFKIDFSEYVKGQTYHGMEKLALNNMMSDTTYMKEYLSYDLYNFLGVPTPEYSYANIKINGEEWGLYLAVEVIEENFIAKNYGSLEGNLYKPETSEIGGGGMDRGGAAAIPGGMNFGGRGNQGANRIQGNVEQGKGKAQTDQQNQGDRIMQKGMNGDQQPDNMGFGNRSNGGADLKYIDDNTSSYSKIREAAVFKTTTDEDFQKVIEMIKNLNDGPNLEEYLDVEEILKYFAVNTYLVNLDSYSGGMYHNYYLYERDGKFSIIPWDLNMSFAGFSMGARFGGNDRNAGSGGNNSAQNVINFPIDKPVTGDLESAPLIGNLLKVDEYKELYHSYLSKIVNEYFDSGVFENSIAKIDNLIDDYVKADATAFFTYEEYRNSLPELINFGKDRTTSVKAQLAGEQPTTTYGNIETTVNLSSLGSMGMGGGKGGNGNMPNFGGQMPNIGETPDFGGKIPNDGGIPDFGGQMPNGGEMPNFNGQMPGGNNVPNFGDQMPNLDTQQGFGRSNDNFQSQFMVNTAILILAMLLVSVFGLVFVYKFKRKRFFKFRTSN
ncbi:CotH kinase family protein [Clostridium thermarum]|uniref:CotH kinase family protein n=1 Tax=Clostridium thermarum TaxID=1716543 RepID=UPI0013D5E2E8|nr:CotH kinase family protein [Clostridium thermarum]